MPFAARVNLSRPLNPKEDAESSGHQAGESMRIVRDSKSKEYLNLKTI